MAGDKATLEALNREYIRSVSEGDVQWFEANLSEDFVDSDPDCSFLDRAASSPRSAAARREEPRHRGRADPRARRRALIHARTTYVKVDGRARRRALHDVWPSAASGGSCVAANVTRL